MVNSPDVAVPSRDPRTVKELASVSNGATGTDTYKLMGTFEYEFDVLPGQRNLHPSFLPLADFRNATLYGMSTCPMGKYLAQIKHVAVTVVSALAHE